MTGEPRGGRQVFFFRPNGAVEDRRQGGTDDETGACGALTAGGVGVGWGSVGAGKWDLSDGSDRSDRSDRSDSPDEAGAEHGA